MFFFNRIALSIFIVLNAGCAKIHQAESVVTSDFLDDYSLLKKGSQNDALLSYWNSGTDWTTYKKIIVAPVIIRKVPDSELNELPHAENYRLKELFEYRIREALKKDHKLVTKPGSDTLRVQFAITDAESAIGKASVEGKITDSRTGELLMASADCRAGSNKILPNTFHSWEDIEQSYQYWATQLSYQLCEKQGHYPCQKPE
ncbi:DUF3313 domain-containing protein [Methylobacter sp. BBA5.1]|uniref:DUF3313 domain-containing protein n=1 Tax=Methylobacter sp. BBA5.1 TaxID=1495064 RepID=UPI0005636BB4|nr:DUF3313 domain-containing protein [Methylobacter sp. BBA5.1]